MGDKKGIAITFHSGCRILSYSWARRGSNTGPLDLQSNALPTAPQTLLWLTMLRIGPRKVLYHTCPTKVFTKANKQAAGPPELRLTIYKKIP